MYIKTFVIAVALMAATSWATSCAYAKTRLLAQSETDAIVSKFQKDYGDTFDRRDAKAMVALLTEHATMQNEWGEVTEGRANIELLVSRLMGGLAEGTKLEDTALRSQNVAENVIVSQGISHRVVPNKEPVEMYFTRVLVNQNGKWLLTATQIARPSSVPKPGAAAITK
jgi:uncharacterized protein (TIGR02246 family)